MSSVCPHCFSSDGHHVQCPHFSNHTGTEGRNTMNRSLKLAAVAATAALALTACADLDDDKCRTQPIVMFFNTSTGHYHYGSPTGKTVPAYKVPQSARKVPGYKPVGPAKPPVVKAPAPGPVYKVPGPGAARRR